MTSLEPRFDPYARSYHDLHRESIQASGEEPEYFAAYKIGYMARQVGDRVAGAALEILDFGCGIGNSMPHFRKWFPHSGLHGLDVSGRSIEVAGASHPDVDLGVIQGARLPLPDDSIDIAMAACVYHHIAPDDRPQWTRELHRVLKPGGHLFVFEHNPLNPLTQRVVRSCAFDDDAILLPRSEASTLLRSAGFTVAVADYIVFFPRPLAFLRPLEKWLAKMPLGAQYAVHGVA